MITINSNENKNFKRCSQLGQKKFREKMGLYLIEGPHLLEEAVASEAEIKLVIINEKFRDSMKNTKDTDKVLDDGIEAGLYKGAEVFCMTDRLFEKLAQTETSQGIIGVIKKNDDPQEVMEKKVLAPSSNVVILDRLQDPGNIGTIIRTAEAAGYKGILVVKGTAEIFAPKVIRAATGSVFRMPVLFYESPAEAIEHLRKYDKKIVATCFETENNYYDIDLKKDIGLVIGNEGNGIGADFMDAADVKIKIPMWGVVESLNAAVAAGIVMFEARRK